MKYKLKGYLEKKEGEIMGIASTQTPDRDGEVINQDGWDLKSFKKNPVIMASHKWHNFPIGRATKIAIEKGKLVFTMVLSEATQEAREASQLVKEGILKAFSVGFIPRKRSEDDRNVIEKSELLEISLVSIPCNPQALVTAKGFKDNEMAQEITKEFNEFLTATQVGNDKTKGGDGKGRNIDKELKQTVQKCTGLLQNLCKELKEEGGAEK